MKHFHISLDGFIDHLTGFIRAMVYLAIALILSFWMVSTIAVREINSYTEHNIMEKR